MPPFGVNLIVHRSNDVLQQELEVIARHRVPLVITSLGAVPELVGAVHDYGGLVFHDVINLRHAAKAIEAGVDGLIAVAAGAGGHTGKASPFALVNEIREVFDYFDVDKDGLLSLKEFQDGCQGMGMVMDEEQSENHFNVLNGGKELTFDLFSNFMYDQMKTGASLEDVLNAWRSLASGDSITDDAINQHFGSREDYAQYLLDNMAANDDSISATNSS